MTREGPVYENAGYYIGAIAGGICGIIAGWSGLVFCLVGAFLVDLWGYRRTRR